MKPLLALPLIGTGGSGGVALTGKIIEMLVDLLPRLADEYAVDILLCVANMNDFMLVQVHVCLLLCKCVCVRVCLTVHHRTCISLALQMCPSIYLSAHVV